MHPSGRSAPLQGSASSSRGYSENRPRLSTHTALWRALLRTCTGLQVRVKSSKKEEFYPNYSKCHLIQWPGDSDNPVSSTLQWWQKANLQDVPVFLYNKKYILRGIFRIYTEFYGAGVHIILQFRVAWDFCLGFLLVLLRTCEEENSVKSQSKSCATFQLCQNCFER